MNNGQNKLESIVEQIGEAVLVTTNTVERLAENLNELTQQMQRQEHQIQQQGYQIFALSEALQTLVDSHVESREQLNQLTQLIQTLVIVINTQLAKNEN